MITAKWEGLDEAMRAIRGLNEVAAPQVLEAALRTVGEPMAEEMAARAPRRTGKTAEDIRVAVSRDEAERNGVALLIGARGGKKGRAYVARFIEFGTAHHPAQPFMRPVWDGHRPHYAADVTAALRPAYDRVVRRLARFAHKRGSR